MLKAEDLPEVSLGLRLRHEHAARVPAQSRQLLARQSGTKQIIMVTDGEPTAHFEPGATEPYFEYPPVPATVDATLREVNRCTRDGIRINTFVLDANSFLRNFVDTLTRLNGGRAFFTTNDALGDYVLHDFVEHRRTTRTSRAALMSASSARRGGSVGVVEGDEDDLLDDGGRRADRRVLDGDLGGGVARVAVDAGRDGGEGDRPARRARRRPRGSGGSTRRGGPASPSPPPRHTGPTVWITHRAGRRWPPRRLGVTGGAAAEEPALGEQLRVRRRGGWRRRPRRRRAATSSRR